MKTSLVCSENLEIVPMLSQLKYEYFLETVSVIRLSVIEILLLIPEIPLRIQNKKVASVRAVSHSDTFAVSDFILCGMIRL